jgi:hypothetical protein
MKWSMGSISNQYPRHVFQNVFDMANLSFKAFVAIEFNKILSG